MGCGVRTARCISLGVHYYVLEEEAPHGGVGDGNKPPSLTLAWTRACEQRF